MKSSKSLFRIGSSLKGFPAYFHRFHEHWSKWSRSKDTVIAAKNYFIGITLPSKQKNMSQVAKRTRLDKNVIQQFISDSPWDADAVLATNISTMSRKFSDDKGILVVDDTGQGKQGTKSPGVKRQYSGTLGKTGNCQILVESMYVTPGITKNADAIYWPTGMRLYLPKEWCEDKQRRKEAGIPEDVEFKTKPEIALDLLDQARETLAHQAVIADAGYGSNGNFREALRERKEPYILAVTPSAISVVSEDSPIIPIGTKTKQGRSRKQPAFPEDVKPKTANIVANDVSKEEWKEVQWSEGTKRDLSGSFVRLRVRVAKDRRPTDETGWLLLERDRTGELKAYICWGVDPLPLEELVEIAHTRWVIEQGFKQMKGELGLDDFEGRKWRGLHHHIAMVIIAFCYLMSLRVEDFSIWMDLPSIPQIRREVTRLFYRRIYEIKFDLTAEEADEFLDEYPVLVPE